MNELLLLIAGAGIGIFTDRVLPAIGRAINKGLEPRRQRKVLAELNAQRERNATALHGSLIGKRYRFQPQPGVDLEVVVQRVGGMYLQTAFLSFVDTEAAQAGGFQSEMSADIEELDPEYWEGHKLRSNYRGRKGQFTPEP